MVVKPFAFMVVAALAVVAAGTGAYVAVRQSSPAKTVSGDAVGSDVLTHPGIAAPGAPVPVDATEELLTEGPDGGDDAALPIESSRGTNERSDAAPPAAPVATQPVTREARTAGAAPEPGATPNASNRRARSAQDYPEVEGWTRVNEPRPPQVPDQMALATVGPDSLGVALGPEERPRIIEELVISADSVIGLQIDTPVSSEDAVVEDDVEARVTRDVVVANETAVPAGTRVMGSVVLVENAGKIKGVSRLGVRFHTVVMDDGAEVPIVTETLYREGKAKGGESAAKIGGAAVGGAILGAIFGGRQGAAIGGAAGAAGGTAMAVAGDAQPATLPAGTTVTVRLSRPATVTVER